MRQIYILRHSSWDVKNDILNDAGKTLCVTRAKELPPFEKIISSPYNRCLETARLLTGQEPQTDKRAGILQMTATQEQIFLTKRQNGMNAVTAIFTSPELLEPVQKAGESLRNLVEATFSQLSPNGKALIVSHDGTMVAMRKIILQEAFVPDYTYDSLQGYGVDETWHFFKLLGG